VSGGGRTTGRRVVCSAPRPCPTASPAEQREQRRKQRSVPVHLRSAPDVDDAVNDCTMPSHRFCARRDQFEQLAGGARAARRRRTQCTRSRTSGTAVGRAVARPTPRQYRDVYDVIGPCRRPLVVEADVAHDLVVASILLGTPWCTSVMPSCAARSVVVPTCGPTGARFQPNALRPHHSQCRREYGTACFHCRMRAAPRAIPSGRHDVEEHEAGSARPSSRRNLEP